MTAVPSLALVALGMILIFASTRPRDRALASLTRAEQEVAARRIADRTGDIAVLAAGVAVYFAFRELGRGRPGMGTLGLGLGLGVILVHSAIYTLTRARAARTDLPEPARPLFLRYLSLNAAGMWLAMTGVWFYLTRDD